MLVRNPPIWVKSVRVRVYCVCSTANTWHESKSAVVLRRVGMFASLPIRDSSMRYFMWEYAFNCR